MRIGLTQRVDEIAAYGERRDALDQKWGELLGKLGIFAIPLSNRTPDPKAYLEALDLDGFILTGGNDLSHLPNPVNAAPERDRLEQAVLEYAQTHELPLLGVCRGLQFINAALGGSLVSVEGHVGQCHKVDWNGETVSVNSFHNWTIPSDGLASQLTATAIDDEGNVEGFRHQNLPIEGIMWHPEREEPFAKQDETFLRSFFFSKGSNS